MRVVENSPRPASVRRVRRLNEKIPGAAAPGIQIQSVFSGGMYVGNDTLHGGRTDFFRRKSSPFPHVSPFSWKRHRRFQEKDSLMSYHTTPPWVDWETPSFTKPNFS